MLRTSFDAEEHHLRCSHLRQYFLVSCNNEMLITWNNSAIKQHLQSNHSYTRIIYEVRIAHRECTFTSSSQ